MPAPNKASGKEEGATPPSPLEAQTHAEEFQAAILEELRAIRKALENPPVRDLDHVREVPGRRR